MKSITERRHRPILSPRSPGIERLISDVPDDVLGARNGLRDFALHWTAEASRWQVRIACRRGGLFGARLDRDGADSALKRALAEIGGDE